MGKDWFFWGGGGRGRSGSSSFSSKKRPELKNQPETNRHERTPAATTGCMYAVLHIFDLPPLNPHRSLNPISPFLHEDHHFEPTTKGVEAPRNSLELGEPLRLKTASKNMWSTLKKEEQATKFLNNVSVGINQIRTSCDLSSSECSSSSPGGAKTPSLVARLMGLDLLPENNNGCSPASMCSSREDRARYLLRDQHRRSGTSSLPETPRGSLARKSDGDRHHHRHNPHHHRLSLQINKENMILGSEDEICRGRFSSSLAEKRNRNREHRENVSEMVKYVKESVSRKVGQDITNYATKDRHFGRKDHRLDTDQVVLLKPNKPFLDFYDDFTRTKNHSPRLVSPKTENPPIKQPQKPISKSNSKENHSQKLNLQSSDIVTYTNQPTKKQPPKKEEPFVRPATTNQANKKGCNRENPLSNPRKVPNILRPAVKKKDRLPFPTLQGKSHQKQAKDVLFVPKRDSQLSSSQSRFCKPTAPTAKGGSPPPGNDGEYEYIQRVLKRAGVDHDTPVSLAKWHSCSQPLDPSIFQYMELFHHSKMKLRCNRRLIFYLADELLAGILKLRLNPMSGSELVEMLCSEIRKLPSADSKVLSSHEEEDDNTAMDAVVGEIERYVAETLVEETAMVVLEVARERESVYVTGSDFLSEAHMVIPPVI
ncbi:unnamed protein product [Cuscuta epithymum]|uniref:DUF3741 domain-containing protein n=1 Tax=Cuscuta epithymum TaxID=186058 RepID=A0AAV0BZT4_9ASTE|nr:unnamed protein product [Cuscuta epithymum]